MGGLINTGDAKCPHQVVWVPLFWLTNHFIDSWKLLGNSTNGGTGLAMTGQRIPPYSKEFKKIPNDIYF